MADKGLPDQVLSDEQESIASERRAFLRRAALAGLPVLLASVRARTAWAQDTTGSPTGSANPSSSTATTAL
jgi:hypothetical protein